MTDRTAIDRADEVRKAGLYLGPFLLGSVAANSIYRVACEGRPFTLDPVSMQSVPWDAAFLAGSAYMVWQLREPVGRVAFAALAIQQVLSIGAAADGVAPDRRVVGTLGLVFAALLTVSGSRYGRRRSVATAGAVFVATFALSWVARTYADGLMGRDSVLRSSPICSPMHTVIAADGAQWHPERTATAPRS